MFNPIVAYPATERDNAVNVTAGLRPNEMGNGSSSARNPSKYLSDDYGFALPPHQANAFTVFHENDFGQMAAHGLPSHVRFDPNFHRDRSISKHDKPAELNLFQRTAGGSELGKHRVMARAGSHIVDRGRGSGSVMAVY